MKDVYGYIRVSTVKQGEKGVSLIEQKNAIERYASQNRLTIVQWFEERETAAKQGRPTFTKMITQLRSGMAAGVVIHKIDRSARNLRDWAELVDMADQGIEIHFVNESIDMGVRGGRLSADIQAVVAADYIRNLREETIKGIRGRLKQGLYPMRAPVGYLDAGGGKVKELDPIKSTVIKELFELYATGEYSLKSLLRYAKHRGLTNSNGGNLSLNGISTILHNPFYTGLIHIKRTGENFIGAHKPVVSKEIFDTVQDVLTGRTAQRAQKHQFIFKRLFTCTGCNRCLIGERQKGYVYYRCHLCRGVSLRENNLDTAVRNSLKYFHLNSGEVAEVEKAQQRILSQDSELLAVEKKALETELNTLNTRLSILTDRLIDEVVDRDTYLQKKNEIISKMQLAKNKLSDNSTGVSVEAQTKALHLELYKNAYLSYETGSTTEKRQMIKTITSNCSVTGKNVAIELHHPFEELCEIKKFAYGDPCRGVPRTLGGKESSLDRFRQKLHEWISKPFPGEEPQSP